MRRHDPAGSKRRRTEIQKLFRSDNGRRRMKKPPHRHVMQVVLSLDPGGTERLVIEISKRLQAQSDLSVCCLDEAGDWATELTDSGIPVIALHRRPGFHPTLALRVRELAIAHGATVLHCHHYSPFVYGCLGALITPGLRVVYTEHGRLSDAPPSRRRKLANQFFARTPGAFFAVSESLREHMLTAGFPPSRVQVIYNGVDAGNLPTAQARKAARAFLSLPEDVFVFGTIARLDPVKNLETTIQAFARLRHIHPRACLVVIGDGPERASLQALAGKLRVAEQVRFTGYQSNTRRLLPAFDAYVNSSISEGVSVTILEAMAAELPVVATRVGGTPEVIADAISGCLVPARDPAALSAVMATLTDDAAFAAQLARAGRRRVQAQFSIETMINRYLQVYGLPPQRAHFPSPNR